MTNCAECGCMFDLDDGGFLWYGIAFCEDCDPKP